MSDVTDTDGERPASPEITAELVSSLRRYFLARVRAHDAEDLVQETLLRVYERAPDKGDAERLDRWVGRVAANLLVDHRRRAGAARDAEDVEAAALPEADEEQGADALVAGWLRSMVAELPEPYRDAMRLVELERRSQREAAEALGLSVSGVKSRVQRGRALVRSRLLSCCRLEFDRRGGVVDWQRRARPDCC